MQGKKGIYGKQGDTEIYEGLKQKKREMNPAFF